MKAIRLYEPGGPDQLRYEDVLTPRPGPGEILIQLKAAALNHRDVWIRVGMQMADRLPLILGSDGAGLVAEVGPGTSHLKVGDSVVINPSLNWGDREDRPSPGFKILGGPDPGTYAELTASARRPGARPCAPSALVGDWSPSARRRAARRGGHSIRLLEPDQHPGTTMGSPREFSAMLALYEAGRLKPVVDSVYPLQDAAAAHRRMDAAQQFGKIVLAS